MISELTNRRKIKRSNTNLGFCTVSIAALWALQTTTLRKTKNICAVALPSIRVVMIATEPKQVERIMARAEYPI